ncbi:MAG: hypothetical protein RJA33_4 [Actinomycetota bacterium]|jgi:ubiquitin-protein ligase
MASVRDRRLESDYRALRATFEAEDLVEIRAIGTAPFEKYMIVYKVPSLRLNSTGQPMRVDATVVEISLPADYPRMPPTARTVAGDVVFHPNFNAAKICLADHWSPSFQLVDIVREIGELLTWQKFNIRSPLNATAAEWSQQHLNEIPLARVHLGGNPVDIKIN